MSGAKRKPAEVGLAAGRSKRVLIEYHKIDVWYAWENFEADEQVGAYADPEPACEVELFVDSAEYDIPEEAKHIIGKTGRGHGHAETDALEQLVTLVKNHEVVKGLFEEGAVTLECTDKPCCAHCSTLLGLLNVWPRTSDTKKSRRTMLAGGAWGPGLNLKEFLVKTWHLEQKAVEDFCRDGQAAFDKVL